MRRVTYHSHGGPEVLVHESAPDPTPGPGELLIRVEAIGVTLPPSNHPTAAHNRTEG